MGKKVIEGEKELYEQLKIIISKEYEVKEVLGMIEKGSYNLKTGVICVKAEMEYLYKIKTLLHEYAHAIDFTIHPELEIRRNQREVVAESVAFLVSLRLGLDTSRESISYIKSWLNHEDELYQIIDMVREIALMVISYLENSSEFTFYIDKENY